MGLKINGIQVDGSINIDGSIYQRQILFVGGGGGGGNVAWASGSVGTNNYMITAAGDGSIVAESKLKFTGSQLLLTGDVSMSGSIYCSSTAYQYIGDINTNGSWRWHIEVATGDLLFEKRVGGVWTYKSKMS